MDSRRLGWKLARLIGSNMVEICDVTVASDIFAATLFTLHSKVTKLWILKIFLEEWDEDDWSELSEDDNSPLLKPTCPFSSTLSSAYFIKLFVNLLHFWVKMWSNLKNNVEERKLKVRKCNSVQSSAELHVKDSMRKALISSSNTDD